MSNKSTWFLSHLFSFLLSIVFLTSCTTATNDKNSIHLVFVVAPDIAYQTTGDIQPDTANLTNQGLNRSLMMASYLKDEVLQSDSLQAIYALSPMTHLQTLNNYPNMTPLAYIQHFALLNQTSLKVDTSTLYTANSFPINVSYGEGSVPYGVSIPAESSPNSIGLDFYNNNGNNDALVADIIHKKVAGYYVFCAPWETISALMQSINNKYDYNLEISNQYQGSNSIYEISIKDSKAQFKRYDTALNPSTSYPQLPAHVESIQCPATFIKIERKGGVAGVIVPADANKNQTLYIVRHAEAHPDATLKFEDGNYVGAGQWRALALAESLKDKIHPDMVYSIDPAQWFHTYDEFNYSYVRPSLTILPYAVANNLPYYLVSEFQLSDDAYAQNPIDVGVATTTSDYFFTGDKFSNTTLLVAWESGHIKAFLNQLLISYGGHTIPQLDIYGPPLGGWPSDDYDTIWRVTLDANGDLTIDNELCEGIDTSKLPTDAPLF